MANKETEFIGSIYLLCGSIFMLKGVVVFASTIFMEDEFYKQLLSLPAYTFFIISATFFYYGISRIMASKKLPD